MMEPSLCTPRRPGCRAGVRARSGALRRLACAVCALLVLIAPGAGVRAETRWGPFLYSSQALLDAVLFGFEHEWPAFDAPGSWRFENSIDWTNVWDYRADQGRIDGESGYVKPALRYTVATGWDVALEWPVQYLGGGVMDGFIEGFHRALGLGQSERDRFPRNELRIERYHPDGSTTVIMDDDDSGWYGRAPIVSSRWLVTRGSPLWPIALKASVNLPTLESANRLVESRGHDWGVGLSTTGLLSARWGLSLGLATIQPRNAPVRQEVNLRGGRISAMASLEYSLGRDSAMVFQVVHNSAVTSATGTMLDLPTTDFLFGWKWAFEDGARRELGIVEDLLIHDNNIDFGLHYAYSNRVF